MIGFATASFFIRATLQKQQKSTTFTFPGQREADYRSQSYYHEGLDKSGPRKRHSSSRRAFRERLNALGLERINREYAPGNGFCRSHRQNAIINATKIKAEHFPKWHSELVCLLEHGKQIDSDVFELTKSILPKISNMRRQVCRALEKCLSARQFSGSFVPV
jgi:hypothetical protein